MTELEIAQQKLLSTQPSWVTDGSADAPARTPQFGPPPQRAAKLEIPMPNNAQITGGSGGGGGSGAPLVDTIVLVGGFLYPAKDDLILGEPL